MTMNKIECITMDDFKHDSHLIDYIDDNIIILDNVDKNFAKLGLFRLDCYILAFCLDGRTDFNVNGNQCIMEAEHCAILIPNTMIRYTESKYPCNIRIAVISSKFLRGLTHIKKEIWDIGFHLYNHPIFPINRDCSYKLYLYKELALTCISEKEHPYSKNAKKYLFASIFCELLGMLYHNTPFQENNLDCINKDSLYIYRKFIKQVNEDDGTHRTVSYYANQLCCTAKYLTTIVKKICGKKSLTIINEHAMECIKYELKHSGKSIKEIADQFNFPNQSFFGKFVKDHIGLSPLQYRISKTE